MENVNWSKISPQRVLCGATAQTYMYQDALREPWLGIQVKGGRVSILNSIDLRKKL